MRGDCIFEDADTKQRLTHFGTLSPDGRSCSDGTSTFRVGERTAYNPELRQIDRGTQGTARQHPPLAYQGEPTTLQRLGTALGRGIERGQQKNKQHEEEDQAAAAAADAKIGSALKTAEEMTPTTLVNGVEAAAQEAEDGIKHAAADPKGTFNRALDRIKQGVQKTAGAVKDGINGAVQAVDQGVDDALDWSKKPVIEQAEDVLKVGGEKAATAPPRRDRRCRDRHSGRRRDQAGRRRAAGWSARRQEGPAVARRSREKGRSQAASPRTASSARERRTRRWSRPCASTAAARTGAGWQG
jgi:hypothetical protein